MLFEDKSVFKEKYNTRKEVTAALSLCVERYINPKNDPRIYMAKEVTFDYATSHMVRVDYIQFKPFNNTVSGIEKGDFYCYEIKSSVEDFHSKNGHNLIGDYNYYVMPEEVYAAVSKEIPYYAGVLVPGYPNLEVVKKTKRKNRDKPLSEILLMMFRSNQREIIKNRKEKESKAAETNNPENKSEITDSDDLLYL